MYDGLTDDSQFYQIKRLFYFCFFFSTVVIYVDRRNFFLNPNAVLPDFFFSLQKAKECYGKVLSG